MAGKAVAGSAGNTNVGVGERIASGIAGAVLVARAVSRPSLGRIALAMGGVALLQRGIMGRCALYEKLGFDTAARRPEQRVRERRYDPVSTASEDSFPASDPPAWTPVAGTAVER